MFFNYLRAVEAFFQLAKQLCIFFAVDEAFTFHECRFGIIFSHILDSLNYFTFAGNDFRDD